MDIQNVELICPDVYKVFGFVFLHNNNILTIF